MTTKNWRDAMVGPEVTIRAAMDRIGSSRQHILLVVGDGERLLGTITDGDLRRAVLREVALATPIRDIMHQEPLTVSKDTSRESCLAVMRQHDVQHLPILDGSRVVGMVTLEDLLQVSRHERANWVVIMAGGRGQRLRPLTDDVPKPMLPIGGRPILETILMQLADQGFRRFFFSVNYKAGQIRSHFGDGHRHGVEIRYLEEDRPLGTAGALRLIPEALTDPFLMMNGDILARVEFGDVVDFHHRSGAELTVCVRDLSVPIPYGVVTLQNENITAIVEKPVQNVQVSAGIYACSPSLPEHVPDGRAYDMPELLQGLIAAKRRVVGYPLRDYWLDIGRLDDLGRAAAEFSTFPGP